MLSQKHSKIIRYLGDLATTSTLSLKHSCAVMIGGKIMAVGVNSHKSCLKDGTLSQHAERGVLKQCCILWN